MDAPRQITHETVMFFDTDTGGVVHNLSYLRMIETNRTFLVEPLGMDLRAMARDLVYPVLIRTEIDYKRPGRLLERLRIEGWLERMERMRFWVAFHIVRESDGTLLVQARQALALVQMPAGKPLRLPADWTKNFGHIGNDVAQRGAVVG